MFRHNQSPAVRGQASHLPTRFTRTSSRSSSAVLSVSMTVTMQYLFQGWNCRVPGKYKDLINGRGDYEEIGHVEMIAVMVGAAARGGARHRDHQGGRGRPGGRRGARRDGPAAGDRRRRRVRCVLTATATRVTAGTSWPAATCWPRLPG